MTVALQLTVILRCYLADNPQDWDFYASNLMYGYNMHAHRVSRTIPFELEMSSPPPDITAHHQPDATQGEAFDHDEFTKLIRAALKKSRQVLEKRQARYKKYSTSTDVYGKFHTDRILVDGLL